MKHSPFFHLSLFAVIGLLIAAAGVVLFYRSPRVAAVTTDAASKVMKASWEAYQCDFIVAGRVFRPSQGNDTVSEGQAYAMLRALWMRDKPTFDACYRWTEKNLSRISHTGDHLLAWHYGRKPDGGYGVLDWNAASDADVDYALALLLADTIWLEDHPAELPGYKEKARSVIADIRRLEVVPLVNGELVLLPWPLKDTAAFPIEINPSYFSPGHYRLFAAATADQSWLKLAESSYAQLDRLMTRLGPLTGVGLVPDWCVTDAQGMFAPSVKRGTASSWDAFRIWWRLRLDYEISGSVAARRILLTGLVPFLQKNERNGVPRVDVEYDYTGRVIKSYESAAVVGVYGWSLYGLSPHMAHAMQRRSAGFYDTKTGTFGERDNYYVNSWAWYAEALGAHHFPFPIVREGQGGGR